VAPETWQAILKRRQEIAVCPDSRIRDELMRDLHGGACRQWLELAHLSGLLYVLFPLLQEVYADPERLERAYALASRYDLMNGPEFLALAALCWPALEFALHRLPAEGLGRSAWMLFVRSETARVTQPFNFTRRHLDRLCRAATPLYFMYGLHAKLPARLAYKAYYPDACLLAEFLGFDLRLPGEEGRKKSRSRRRRGGKKPEPSGLEAPAGQ
jgi:poly(A) polymerase